MASSEYTAPSLSARSIILISPPVGAMTTTKNTSTTSSRRPRSSAAPWLFMIFWLLILALIAVIVLTLASIYQGEVILSGVSALGQDLGGRTRSEAVQMLRSEWQNRKIILDGREQSWTLSPEQVGVILDAEAVAENAYQQGRGETGVSSLLPTARRILASSGLVPIDAEPTAITASWYFDRGRATETVRTLAGQIDIPMQNAGVTVIDGQVETTSAQAGRVLVMDHTPGGGCSRDAAFRGRHRRAAR